MHRLPPPASTPPCSRHRDDLGAQCRSFVVGREHLKGYMAVRDQYITDRTPH
jgi:hypothetical protein